MMVKARLMVGSNYNILILIEDTESMGQIK